MYKYILLLSVLCITPVYAEQPQQFIPVPGGSPLFGPITPNAYGPGIHSDATGRAFSWQPQYGGSGYPDPTLQVQPNAYGLGTGMDQYGRPVTPSTQGDTYGFHGDTGHIGEHP